MKKSRFLRQLAWIMILCLDLCSAHAALHKFSIIPILRPQTPIAANGVALAQYLIINNTYEPRMLTVAPQDGVVQLTPTGGCSSPFILIHNQSCLLTLQILGALTQGGVHSGPVICKTKGVGDNNPDYFLCTTADLINSIKVSTTGKILPATISGTASAAIVTINNISFDASADNLQAILPPASTISMVSTCPKALPPQSSCTFYFSSTTAGTVNVVVQGTNTNSVTLPITFNLQAMELRAKNSLSFTRTPLTLSSGKTSEKFSLSLVSPTQSSQVSKVKIYIPSDLPVSVSNKCDAGLDFSNPTCELDFVAGETTGSGTLSIQGLNDKMEPVTNKISIPIKVLSSSLATLDISPSSGIINLNDPGRSTVFTITNNLASPVPLSHIRGFFPPEWLGVSINNAEDCDNLAPGASCNISFAATTPNLVKGEIKIEGENSPGPLYITLAFVKTGSKYK
ncbi:MAG: hypothetical protein H0U57_08525 [Tatlockia sp.]|nr:hypothetical protein [Tatlockia sp.]